MPQNCHKLFELLITTIEWLSPGIETQDIFSRSAYAPSLLKSHNQQSFTTYLPRPTLVLSTVFVFKDQLATGLNRRQSFCTRRDTVPAWRRYATTGSAIRTRNR